MLNRFGLTGGLINRVHYDAVLTTFENLLTLKFDRRLGTIRPVYKAAVRMDVDRARRLARPDVVGLGQCLSAVRDLWVDSSFRNMYILFCVSIDTYIQGFVG